MATTERDAQQRADAHRLMALAEPVVERATHGAGAGQGLDAGDWHATANLDRSEALPSPAVDPEPGEVIFFHGHPSWRSMAGLYAKGLLAAIVVGVIAGAIGEISDSTVHVAWVILAVLVVFVLVIALGALQRIRTTYGITNQRLTIETGILSRDVHQTRLERVQNVNSSQSVWERLLHFGTVDFDTAAETEYDFSFRGVGDPRGIVRTVDRALHELRGGTETASDV
jgi:membrane protein YdbS with pleckstrin-like domain